MHKRNRSEKLNAAKIMPELKHSVPRQPFDITRSEVVAWLIEQPDILQFIFNKVQNIEIKFNGENGTWVGVDYDD